jgi:FlaA1/EpsC-like NDP-sugar epimerase
MNMPPALRIWVRLLLYGSELAASLWLAYELRFDFMVGPVSAQERLVVLSWLVPLQLVLLALFLQFSPLLGYFSTPDLGRMCYALVISAALAMGLWFALGAPYAPPRSVILIDLVFSMVGLTGVRLALRTLRETLASSAKTGNGSRPRVAIIGAGDAGALLAHELLLKPGYRLDPVAFFDDDSGKWSSRVHGIRVLGPPERITREAPRLHIREAIIAMPSAPARRVGEIVHILRRGGLACRTVPSLEQLANGLVRVSQLRNVEVQDLLGRERVELATENIRQLLRGRVVLVTGAGGSIGAELCRQIVSYQPKRLLLVERSEPQAFQIEQELIRSGYGPIIVTLVADIFDAGRMKEVFAQYTPQVVFHAAAHKHVPMMEHQPGEAIKNNSLGTAQLAETALEFGVERFILISSDKAINPTSVMGATKRLAEMYVQALAAAFPESTKFIAVRFGNVLGSSGSVIPVFQRQIAEGGPVRVTHPEMTRYFMTIPEACMLVLQSMAQGDGGEIFVLDMGKPIRIVDLACQMIELSGLKPHDDIKIEFTGVRPGEKLFEELSYKKENLVPTAHRKIFRFISEPLRLDDARRRLQSLRDQLHSKPANALKLLLHDCVPDYSPWLGGELADLPGQPDPEPKRAPASDQPLDTTPSFSEGRITP